MYQIENSISTYEITSIAGVPVYMFEHHNMAFPAWGTVSSRANQPYILVTFDYHTDTRNPFSKVKANGEYDIEWIESLKLKRNLFNFQDAFQLAIEMVAYDEQIKTAYKYGYIRGYYVICAEDERGCFFGEDCDKFEGYNAAYYNKDHIEEFVKCFLQKIGCNRVIVDFDIDFFNSEADFDISFFEKIAPVLNKAEAITIAREKWHFENLKESPEFEHERAIDLLIGRLKEVMS